MRHNRWLQALIILLVLIASVYLLELLWKLGQRFAGVLLLFFLAWTVAFALSPLIEALVARRVPRLLAVTGLYVVIVLVVLLFGVLAVPAIVQQVNLLAGSIPASSSTIMAAVDRVHSDLVARGVSDEFLLPAAKTAADRVDALSAQVMANSLSLPVRFATGLFDGILVLVLSFYMALDGPTIMRKLLSLVPPAYRRTANLFVDSVSSSFGGFIRTQLVLALVAALFTGVVMRLFGLGYVLTVAVVCGLIMLVPMVGNILALVPPVFIALVQGQEKWTALWVFLALWAAQQVLLNIVAPRLLGQSVGLHPLLVFFAMLLGASTAGAWGAIFGVPVVAVGVVMARHFYRVVLIQTPLFAGTAGWPRVSDADVPPESQERAAGPFARSEERDVQGHRVPVGTVPAERR